MTPNTSPGSGFEVEGRTVLQGQEPRRVGSARRKLRLAEVILAFGVGDRVLVAAFGQHAETALHRAIMDGFDLAALPFFPSADSGHASRLKSDAVASDRRPWTG